MILQDEWTQDGDFARLPRSFMEAIMHKHDPAFVAELAQRVFRDSTKAEEWLNQPRFQLGGRTPMQMLDTEEGVRRVEELLTQIDDDKRFGIA